MTTFRELLSRTKSEIDEIDFEEGERRLNNDPQTLWVDIREADEYENGAIPGAHHIPRGFLELRIENVVPAKDTPLVLYCAGGTRSAFGAKSLRELGYTDVVSLTPGFNGWKDKGGKFTIPRILTPEQKRRYHRHLLMPEVGETGQMKLLDSSVLLLGAGGLGSPAALYLAAAGVGRIGIVDFDIVDTSNLQRQILHNEARVGELKVESAKQTLQGINPDIEVEAHAVRLSSANVMDLFADYDVIVDGCDNFPTRYLTNDASVLLDKPVVHGSIFRFEGQVSVFWPGKGPCYRCLYVQPPPPDLAPSCAEAGVLGVLPGIIGSIQALEAIKVLLGIGDPLVGKLLTFDALEMSFRTLKLRRDPECPACGDASQVELVDYDEYCIAPNMKPKDADAKGLHAQAEEALGA
ncbi:MAG: molybdopterin-synthase adenylyltransferase MoeB [Acidimicrobiia bacterium]|nr:molybdopterin-synthase adenylyltransferase MoeB [Acidimicrobiia bacterium]